MKSSVIFFNIKPVQFLDRPTTNHSDREFVQVEVIKTDKLS